MRKIISILFLLVLFSSAMVAEDGDIPNGGKSSCQSYCLTGTEENTESGVTSFWVFLQNNIKNLLN